MISIRSSLRALLFAVLFALPLCTPCTLPDEPSEHEAVKQLFYSLIKEDGNDDQQLFANSSMCAWRGVVCECGSSDVTHRRVIGIEWSRRDLRGTLPTAPLTALPMLQTLDLSYNSLSGSLPALGNGGTLRHLSTLRLAHNELTGALPLSLVALHALILLDLSSNRFSGDARALLTSATAPTAVNLSFNAFSSTAAALDSNVHFLDERGNDALPCAEPGARAGALILRSPCNKSLWPLAAFLCACTVCSVVLRLALDSYLIVYTPRSDALDDSVTTRFLLAWAAEPVALVLHAIALISVLAFISAQLNSCDLVNTSRIYSAFLPDGAAFAEAAHNTRTFGEAARSVSVRNTPLLAAAVPRFRDLCERIAGCAASASPEYACRLVEPALAQGGGSARMNMLFWSAVGLATVQVGVELVRAACVLASICARQLIGNRLVVSVIGSSSLFTPLLAMALPASQFVAHVVTAQQTSTLDLLVRGALLGVGALPMLLVCIAFLLESQQRITLTTAGSMAASVLCIVHYVCSLVVWLRAREATAASGECVSAVKMSLTAPTTTAVTFPTHGDTAAANDAQTQDEAEQVSLLSVDATANADVELLNHHSQNDSTVVDISEVAPDTAPLRRRVAQPLEPQPSVVILAPPQSAQLPTTESATSAASVQSEGALLSPPPRLRQPSASMTSTERIRKFLQRAAEQHDDALDAVPASALQF